MAKSFCRHEVYKSITHIKEPRYHDNCILIDTRFIKDAVEHYVFRFAKEGVADKYGWFYLSGKNIRRAPTQPNSKTTEVYQVPLNYKEEFKPIKDCQCNQAEFDLFK